MAKITIQTLGRKLVAARENKGIREAAKEIGVSPATLSRVERGNLPDLETFGKICKWLKIDPGHVLGVTQSAAVRPTIAVNFRKDQALDPNTARALANMILAAQRAVLASEH